MRCLLLYPQMPDTFYAMHHFMQVVGKKAAYPPLGLLTVAAMLPAEWNKKVIDLNVHSLTDIEIEWADIIMISAMNVQELSVREIIARCRPYGKLLVAGGPLFTHEYERFPEINHFVLNEAELTLPEFLEDMSNNNARRLYQSNLFADTTKTPLPAFELIDMRDYLYAIVQYSRGCPFLCDFCDVTTLYGRTMRVKKTEQLIAELNQLNGRGDLSLVLFADDNFIGNKKVLKYELLPALIEWRKKYHPPFFFATQLTINLCNDADLMDLMIDAGFRHIFIGIETPDEDSLNAALKNQNLRRNLLDNIHTIHAKGFIISGGFIVGFDEDKPDIFDRQQKFIQESGVPLPIINILKAPPGTALYDRISEEGRLTKPFAFLEGETNIAPKMPLKQLYEGFLSLTKQVYTPAFAFERLIHFFKQYHFPKTDVKIRSKFTGAQLRILLRIIWTLGIWDANRKYFWKLIFWSVRHQPKLLDKAVLYGVMMYQMNQTYKTISTMVGKELSKLPKN